MLAGHGPSGFHQLEHITHVLGHDRGFCDGAAPFLYLHQTLDQLLGRWSGREVVEAAYHWHPGVLCGCDDGVTD